MAAQPSWIVRDYNNTNQASGSHPIFNSVSGDAGVGVSLARSENPIRRAGTIQKLSLFRGLDQFVADYSCHVNGSDTALAVRTLGSGSGQIEDTTSEVVVADGDEITYQATFVSGAGTNRYSNAKYEFQPSGPETVSHMYAKNVSFAPTFQNNSQIERCNIIGLLDETGTASDERTTWKVNTAGTWRGCYVYSNPNTRGSDSEVHPRVNNVKQGGILVTVTAGMTGVFDDSSGTVTLAADDDINWGVENFTGGGNWRAEQISSMITRVPKCWDISPWNVGGASLNHSLTRDNPPGSAWRYASSGTFFEIVSGSNQTFRRFETRVQSNALGSGVAESWMEINDSAPGNSPSLVQIPAGQTGRFISRDQQKCFVGDLVTLRSRSTTSSGNWSRNSMQCEESPEIVNPTELFWQMPVVHVEGGTR